MSGLTKSTVVSTSPSNDSAVSTEGSVNKSKLEEATKRAAKNTNTDKREKTTPSNQ